jgi:DnaJ-class molecular chaperone
MKTKSKYIKRSHVELCYYCTGSGKIRNKPCKQCKGTGKYIDDTYDLIATQPNGEQIAFRVDGFK